MNLVEKVGLIAMLWATLAQIRYDDADWILWMFLAGEFVFIIAQNAGA